MLVSVPQRGQGYVGRGGRGDILVSRGKNYKVNASGVQGGDRMVSLIRFLNAKWPSCVRACGLHKFVGRTIWEIESRTAIAMEPWRRVTCPTASRYG